MPKFIKLIIITKNRNSNTSEDLEIFRKTKTIKITSWTITKLIFPDKFRIRRLYKYGKRVRNKEDKKQ
jgi:hypothetical protein